MASTSTSSALCVPLDSSIPVGVMRLIGVVSYVVYVKVSSVGVSAGCDKAGFFCY